MDQSQPPTLPPSHQNHLNLRRERGSDLQRHLPNLEPPPSHAERARRTHQPRSRQTNNRHHYSLPCRSPNLLPSLGRSLPSGPSSVPSSNPELPSQNRISVLNQRVPLLRIQGESEAGSVGVRALPTQRGDGGPLQ